MEKKEREYIVWQNRSFRFYLAARLLYANEQYSSAAFCGQQALESLIKATLLFHDASFKPEEACHKVTGMIRTVKNKVPGAKRFCVPDYFYKDKRYQAASRYPLNGGILILGTFLPDLDSVFFELVAFVPFQFNSELIHALSGKNKKDLAILRKGNKQMASIKKILKVKVRT